jgi:hypothetical protein
MHSSELAARPAPLWGTTFHVAHLLFAGLFQFRFLLAEIGLPLAGGFRFLVWASTTKKTAD